MQIDPDALGLLGAAHPAKIAMREESPTGRHLALSPVTNAIGKAYLRRLHGTTRQQTPAGQMTPAGQSRLSFSNTRLGHGITQRRGLVVDERRAARTISSTAFDCEFCIAQKDSAQHLTSEHHGSQHTYHKQQAH